MLLDEEWKSAGSPLLGLETGEPQMTGAVVIFQSVPSCLASSTRNSEKTSHCHDNHGCTGYINH